VAASGGEADSSDEGDNGLEAGCGAADKEGGKATGAKRIKN
jgi:hypothetical protein